MGFFWLNRNLMNEIFKIAVDCIQSIASRKGLSPAIFIALHTFKRNGDRNVHLHVSTTTGGISRDLKKWGKLYFSHKVLKILWKNKIIALFRRQHKEGKLSIPLTIQTTLNTCYRFSHFLNFLYEKEWIINCAKPSSNYTRNLEYFGRYTKRPPIAESKIKKYDGKTVTFAYKNHKTGQYEDRTVSVFKFIALFIQHIPDTGFRMIRYYGILASRIKTKVLHILQNLLERRKNQKQKKITFASMLHGSFGINPFICPSCGHNLEFFRIIISHNNEAQSTLLKTP